MCVHHMLIAACSSNQILREIMKKVCISHLALTPLSFRYYLLLFSSYPVHRESVRMLIAKTLNFHPNFHRPIFNRVANGFCLGRGTDRDQNQIFRTDLILGFKKTIQIKKKKKTKKVNLFTGIYSCFSPGERASAWTIEETVQHFYLSMTHTKHKPIELKTYSRISKLSESFSDTIAQHLFIVLEKFKF